jgi:hypothetical protein
MDNKISRISAEDAIKKFRLNEYFTRLNREGHYILYEGNHVFSGEHVLLNMSPFCRQNDVNGILIVGEFTLPGVIFQDDILDGELLFVLGTLNVKSINKGGAEFYIKGNLVAEQTIFGSSPNGSLTVEGNTSAEAILSERHRMKFTGSVTGTVINLGSIEGVNPDFTDTTPLLTELVNESDVDVCHYVNIGKSIVKAEHLKVSGAQAATK